MEQEEYFRVDREWIRVDDQLAVDQASCYGVNLAFAAVGVGLAVEVVAGMG
jgi:hypothetical protein